MNICEFYYVYTIRFILDNTYGQNVVFSNGECIKVIGASPKAGYLSVESRNKTGWVPSKLTKLMVSLHVFK